MIKIRVQKNLQGVQHLGLYTYTEVTEETYKIIERKVIENATKNIQLQIFLKETNITLPKLMETAITETIVHEAITESINDIRNKKI